MKKIIKIIFVSILFIFLSNCYLKSKESPLINNFPISIFKIQSGSMMPEINIGEIIVLWKNNNYKENDIITYKINNYFVTHRIIEKTDEGYITKGDSNNTEDKQIVIKDKIKGKVIFHSKVLGIIYKFRYWLISILIILLLV